MPELAFVTIILVIFFLDSFLMDERLKNLRRRLMFLTIAAINIILLKRYLYGIWLTLVWRQVLMLFITSLFFDGGARKTYDITPRTSLGFYCTKKVIISLGF
jgi:hypothetical protein